LHSTPISFIALTPTFVVCFLSNLRYPEVFITDISPETAFSHKFQVTDITDLLSIPAEYWSCIFFPISIVCRIFFKTSNFGIRRRAYFPTWSLEPKLNTSLFFEVNLFLCLKMKYLWFYSFWIPFSLTS
jgi:hypothetical protein